MNAINAFDIFCSCYTVISAVAVQLLFHESNLLASQRLYMHKQLVCLLYTITRA